MWVTERSNNYIPVSKDRFCLDVYCYVSDLLCRPLATSQPELWFAEKREGPKVFAEQDCQSQELPFVQAVPWARTV